MKMTMARGVEDEGPDQLEGGDGVNAMDWHGNEKGKVEDDPRAQGGGQECGEGEESIQGAGETLVGGHHRAEGHRGGGSEGEASRKVMKKKALH